MYDKVTANCNNIRGNNNIIKINYNLPQYKLEFSSLKYFYMHKKHIKEII